VYPDGLNDLMKEMLMRKLSRLGLFLIAATAMGCAYPELKMGAGGPDAAAGTQATGGSHAGGSAAGAAGTSSGGKGGNVSGSAAGATSTVSSGKGGSSGIDAGVRDAPGSQPDVPVGGTGGGGTSTGGTSSVGGSSGSSSGAGPNCPALTDPANGSVSASTTTPGSTAVYSCDPGYNLSGSMTRTCQADGMWTVAAPTCTIVDCGALKNPTNGTVVASPTTYGSKADYTCQTGYGLAGTSPRICQADGNWSGTAPTCGLADCPAPPSIANGAPTTTGTTFGSTATYACNPGYELSGTATDTCQADRSWSDSPPTCNIVDCGSPAIGFGSYSPFATTYGSTVKFTCNDCYALSGASTRTCQADGTWSGLQPTCTVVDCGMPPNPANGKATVNGGTTCSWSALYSCNTGYSFSTTAQVSTCQADGTWSTPIPACSIQRLDLTVTRAGTGTGKVTSSDGGISCPSTCVATYNYGTIVILTAQPDANQIFTGWSGEGCTGLGSCQVTLTGLAYVTANFSQPPNIMFTTSTLQTAASLGGLTGADALCMNLAANAKLTGNYKAWLSTNTVSAASRLGAASGWVRTDGKPVFNNIGDIPYNKLFYPPRLDEKGNDLGLTLDPTAPEIVVITNTSSAGAMPTYAAYGTCNNFTSDDGTTIKRGSAGYNSADFTEHNDLSCSFAARLYCFGVDHQAQVSVTPTAGRHAFLSYATWTPGGGISAADTLCQKEATAANLPGSYKALLASTGTTSASRFVFGPTTLPWVRSDGVLIAPTANAFFSASLFDSSPNVTADGLNYFGYTGVWSGAASPTTVGTDASNCANWTSSNASAYGWLGAAGDSWTKGFFDLFEQTISSVCNANWDNLLCLQE
jgi:hypothetical protein